MRTATDNVLHQAQHRAYPAPDAEDLACLAAIADAERLSLAALAEGGPDRRPTPGPCLERLRFAGFIGIGGDALRGAQVLVTEAGRAAIAAAARDRRSPDHPTDHPGGGPASPLRRER